MVKMKIDKLKKNVIKHLQSEGFVCLEQDRGKFPHIIAWHPLIDAGGKLMTLDTSFSKDGKTEQRSMVPFMIFNVQCKPNKYIGKKDKEKAIEILKTRKATSFLVAFEKDNKPSFYEIFLSREGGSEDVKYQSYIG